MPAPPFIRLEAVSKAYVTRHGDVHALDDVSLTVDAGQYAAICGPSGCGKSTLLSLIGGLALPTAGSIAVGDLAMSTASSAERARFRASAVQFRACPSSKLAHDDRADAPPLDVAERREEHRHVAERVHDEEQQDRSRHQGSWPDCIGSSAGGSAPTWGRVPGSPARPEVP